MILKPTKKGLQNLKVETPKESPKKERKSSKNTLPSDTYKPMFEPIRFLVKETFSHKDPTKMVKQYLELSVKRFGEDDENAPMVYIQMYQESEFYTGYLKGKTVYFPIEMFEEVMSNLHDLDEECEKRHI